MSDNNNLTNDIVKNPDVSYEHKDVNVRGIVYFGIGLLAVIIFAMILIAWLLASLDNRTAAEQGNQPSAVVVPPEPRLQPNPIDETASPVDELTELRIKEERILNTYGWVDREEGVARIPIDQAMEIVVEEYQ